MSILRLLRLHQWVKNVLVFVPFLFAARSTEWLLTNIWNALIAFLAFCVVSSAIYIFNDIRDLERDKEHPIKRFRPLPSGKVDIRFAISVGVTLLLLALVLSWPLGWMFGGVILLYVLNNIAYTLFLKRLQLFDVFSISIGFVLRVVAGAVAVGVPVSIYLFLTVFFLALFLAIGKRRYELLLLGKKGSVHRDSLRYYSIYYLDQIMNISATLTLVVYTLYTIEKRDMVMVLTVPVVVFGIFRYYHITHNLRKGEPSDDLLSDPYILLSGLIYVLIILLSFLKLDLSFFRWW
ncbi:MAG: decaprenyl-phosphate phosphoribosyltransferase [Thermotogae bacterium]|nr:decaprenyl-phosphate phosphoribosyltransferase [Thermotogota bacterium]